MANRIVLSWTVSVAGSSRTPAQAVAALEQSNAPLYVSTTNDPVLGQFFGLTVENDATTPTADGATRTLTLNMDSAVGAPFAPPAFPCHPTTSTPPALPYPLTVAEELDGSFLVTSGSDVVSSTKSQLATLDATDVVQFSAQPGVDYAIVSVSAGGMVIAPAFTGQTDNSSAVVLVPAPVSLPTGAPPAAIYSSSPLDSLTGSGARTVSLSYTDSLGASATVVVDLDGAYPVHVTLAGGTIDITIVTDMHVASVGGFGNSVGQITLSSLTEAILSEDTQDEAQLKLDLALVYLPPSYFAIAQPMASAPQLVGDFFVTTNSPNVPTSVDQTVGPALSPGDVIQFAAQEEIDTPFGAEQVTYEVLHVGPKTIILATPFTGFDFLHRPVRPDEGTKSTRGDTVINLATGATLVSPSPAALPSDAALKTPLAQFVNPGIAVPPPNQPLVPATMLPAPTFLSGFFTQTLQLALAGVPVVPAAITFA